MPETTEQERIAEALDDIDALTASLERLIAKKRDLKQAAMQQLLTSPSEGGTRLPDFRGKWEATRLGDHVRYLNHGVHARAELVAEGSVKYLHYGDVHAANNVWLDAQLSTLSCLPVERASHLDRLENGDLVLVDASEDVSGVGKSVELRNVNGTEIVSGLHTIAARFDKTMLADGFKGYLQFMPTFKKHLEKLAAGTKVYASNRTHVSSVELPLPHPDEQRAIANILTDMSAELAALEQRLDKTSDLKKAMMQELLAGKTRLVRPGGAHA